MTKQNWTAFLTVFFVLCMFVSPAMGGSIYDQDSPAEFELNSTVNGGYTEDHPMYNWLIFTLPNDGTFHLTETETVGFVSALIMTTTPEERGGVNIVSYGYSDDGKTYYYALQAGTYKIRVENHLTDPYSYSLTNVYTPASLTNDPEPNDTFEEASGLPSYGSSSGHLGYVYDAYGGAPVLNFYDAIDWWNITTAADGVLSISTVSDEGLVIYLKLYDQDQQPIVTGYNDGVNTNVEYYVAQGTYYVLAEIPAYGGFGSYSITSTRTPATLDNDPEPNDTWEQAVALKIGGSDTGHLGFCTAGGEYVTLDTSDYWKIITSADGVLNISTVSNDVLAITLDLCDENMTRLKYAINDGVNTNVEYHVARGTYYVQVGRRIVSEHISFGSYSITSDLTPASLENDPEPNDTWEHAAVLEPGGSDTGHLGFCTAYPTFDTSDYWKITTTADGDMDISTVSDEDLQITLYLYDENMTRLKYVYNDGVNTRVQYTNAVQGTYYVQVERRRVSGHIDFGSYTINVSSPGPTTHVDDVPLTFRLNPPYPNPFNPATTIRYEIPVECHVTLMIYDILGRKIAVLQDGKVFAGIHEAVWDGRDDYGVLVGSGVYLYQFTAGTYFSKGKIMFLR